MNRKLTALIITALTVAASLITIFVFLTGRNVPDLLPDVKHPVTTDSNSKAMKPLTPEKGTSATRSGPTLSTPGHQKIEKSPGPFQAEKDVNRKTEPDKALTTSSEAISPKKAQQKVQVKDFIFDLQDCKAGEQDVACLLTITNKGSDRELFICGRKIPWPMQPEVKNVTRIFDDSGNDYAITTASLANKTVKFGPYEYCVSSLLVSGVPTIARLNFDNVSQKAGMISLLELSLAVRGEGNFIVQFRNIPLTR